MVLPVPGGGNEDVDPAEAEHGRSIYCDSADSWPLRGGGETAGDTGPNEMVEADGDRLEGSKLKGGNKGSSRSGGGGGAGVDGLGIGA